MEKRIDGVKLAYSSETYCHQCFLFKERQCLSKTDYYCLSVEGAWVKVEGAWVKVEEPKTEGGSE